MISTSRWNPERQVQCISWGPLISSHFKAFASLSLHSLLYRDTSFHSLIFYIFHFIHHLTHNHFSAYHLSIHESYFIFEARDEKSGGGQFGRKKKQLSNRCNKITSECFGLAKSWAINFYSEWNQFLFLVDSTIATTLLKDLYIIQYSVPIYIPNEGSCTYSSHGWTYLEIYRL